MPTPNRLRRRTLAFVVCTTAALIAGCASGPKLEAGRSMVVVSLLGPDVRIGYTGLIADLDRWERRFDASAWNIDGHLEQSAREMLSRDGRLKFINTDTDELRAVASDRGDTSVKSQVMTRMGLGKPQFAVARDNLIAAGRKLGADYLLVIEPGQYKNDPDNRLAGYGLQQFFGGGHQWFVATQATLYDTRTQRTLTTHFRSNTNFAGAPARPLTKTDRYDPETDAEQGVKMRQTATESLARTLAAIGLVN